MLLSLVVVLGATPPSLDADWSLGEVRAWLSGAQGPMHASGEEPPVPSAVELKPGTASYLEVVALVRRACNLTTAPPPEVPPGHLWEADLDGDGVPERVFSGGCSPDPYFVALKKGPGGWATWREGNGFLLKVARRGDDVIFVAAHDGYGIARESALRLEPGAAPRTLEFSVVGEQKVTALAAMGETCELVAATKVRSEPRLNDAPEDSGMGFDYPGNLLQVFAKGARGLAIGSTGAFRLCAFARPPSRDDSEDQVRSMRTPAALSVGPQTTAFLLGWVPATAVRSNRVPNVGPARPRGTVTWELDVADERLRAFISARLVGAKQCHEQEVRKNPQFAGGVLEVRFALSPAGRFVEVNLEGAAASEALVSCLKTVVEQWRLPLAGPLPPRGTLRLTLSPALP